MGKKRNSVAHFTSTDEFRDFVDYAEDKLGIEIRKSALIRSMIKTLRAHPNILAECLREPLINRAITKTPGYQRRSRHDMYDHIDAKHRREARLISNRLNAKKVHDTAMAKLSKKMQEEMAGYKGIDEWYAKAGLLKDGEKQLRMSDELRGKYTYDDSRLDGTGTWQTPN